MAGMMHSKKEMGSMMSGKGSMSGMKGINAPGASSASQRGGNPPAGKRRTSSAPNPPANTGGRKSVASRFGSKK